MSKVLKVANCFLIYDYKISCKSNKLLKYVLLLPRHMNLHNHLKQVCIEFSAPWHMTLEGGELRFQICTIQKGNGACDNLVYLPSSLWFFSWPREGEWVPWAHRGWNPQSPTWSWHAEMEVFLFLLPPPCPPPPTEKGMQVLACDFLFCNGNGPLCFCFTSTVKVWFQHYNREARAMVRNPELGCK